MVDPVGKGVQHQGQAIAVAWGLTDHEPQAVDSGFEVVFLKPMLSMVRQHVDDQLLHTLNVLFRNATEPDAVPAKHKGVVVVMWWRWFDPNNTVGAVYHHRQTKSNNKTDVHRLPQAVFAAVTNDLVTKPAVVQCLGQRAGRVSEKERVQ